MPLAEIRRIAEAILDFLFFEQKKAKVFRRIQPREFGKFDGYLR